MSDNIYCVYKHTSPSGKSYIGITKDLKRRNREHRFNKGCTAFHNAIVKYRWHNFIHEILCEGLTQQEALECEEYMIRTHNTLIPFGYNILSKSLPVPKHAKPTNKNTNTDIPYKTSPETRLKLSANHRTKKTHKPLPPIDTFSVSVRACEILNKIHASLEYSLKK